jgi:hypothetical protein
MKIVRIANILETLVRFSTRGTMPMLSFVQIAALLIVWIFSEPIFKLRGHYTRSSRQKLDKQKQERCILNNGIGRSAIPLVGFQQFNRQLDRREMLCQSKID